MYKDRKLSSHEKVILRYRKAIQRYAHINGYSVVEEFCGQAVLNTMYEDPYVFHFETKRRYRLIVQEWFL